MKARNVLISALVAFWFGATCLFAEWPISPTKGVLVLRNGSVLAGNVTSVGDYYIVTFGNQSEVRLPAEQVEMRCADLEEAYRWKQRALPEGEVTAHLKLASWCLNQKLFARAADQVLVAYTIAPDEPAVAAMERRLLFAAQPTERQSDPPRQAACLTAPTAVPHENAESLPNGTVEQFTQTVQPVLLNRCGANACHGVLSKNELRLVQPPRGTAVPSRYTRRNLRSVLAYVDRTQPELSRLITEPCRVHGGLDLPVFDERSMEQRRALVQWVHTVSGKGMPVQERPLDNPSRTEFADGSRQQPQQPIPLPMTTFGIPKASEATAVHRTEYVTPAPPSTPSNEAPQAPPAVAPHDPLDPAIFNQRFRNPPSLPNGNRAADPHRAGVIPDATNSAESPSTRRRIRAR